MAVSWHSLATPSPARRTDLSLSGVSCTPTNFCLAAYKVTALWEGTAGQLRASPAPSAIPPAMDGLFMAL
jgi:hypothetical protein